MISDHLLSLVRCPDCRGSFGRVEGLEGRVPLTCTGCGRNYDSPADYLDLRPLQTYAEQTKYLDQALHADARHERVSPPLLGSRIRNDMLRQFLAPGPGELVVDLGCGSGRALLWNRDTGATMAGVDIAPFFSHDARQHVDLMLGDLRKLPFADGTFDKAWSLDVLEHLSPEALAGMLAEASRVLKPGGSLFVYTHARKNAAIAAGLRWINRLAGQLERWGLVDLRQERLRKSDHLNPLRDVPHLEQVAAGAGFRIARIRFYTPIVGGLVENILMRVVERAMARRAAARIAAERGRGIESGVADGQESGRLKPAATDDVPTYDVTVREVRTAAKERIARGGPTYAALRVLSFAMKLDLLLFGRVTSGPFFALLVKEKGVKL